MAFQMKEGDRVEVVLMQDAVYLRRDFGAAVQAACAEDVASRNAFHHAVTMDYGEILKKIMEAPSVVCW